SLSDLYGRQRILRIGLMAFALGSIFCAVAPNGELLIAARAFLGLAGALLVPSSLALIVSHFSGSAQGHAIGTWTAWTGMAFLFGPLLGGFFVDTSSWRLVFAINLLPIALTLWLLRRLPSEKITKRAAVIDWVGALLCTIGLGALVYGLIEQSTYGFADPRIIVSIIIGVLLLVGFWVYERRHADPMLPPDLFSNRNFSVGNLATISIYAGLSIATFLLAVFLQQTGGYSAVQAGLALMPITLIMFFLSPRFGKLSGQYGPRWFMAGGPILGALGFISMLSVESNVDYISQLLPGIMLFGIGLSITVSPLTSAVLGAVSSAQAGIASAVNNMVARVAGLIGIALIGLVAGSQLGITGFHNAVIVTASLLLIGGVIAAIGIENSSSKRA
ncbi:MAG TPA: MFS transporter, partial [Patescibacteria group bacterium]|nr:MFS transporter [Patescibacteria group bacterium]